MSKEYLKKVFGSVCNETGNDFACNMVGKIGNRDLRFNENKRKTLEDLKTLKNQQNCPDQLCDFAADGTSVDLTNTWKRNKL